MLGEPIVACLVAIGFGLAFGVGTAEAGEEKVPTRVTADEHNRLLLNGEPWFPLCLSPTPPPLDAKDPHGRDALEVLAGAGIDSFRIGVRKWDPDYFDTCEDYLDWLGKHGMYGFLYLRELGTFDPKYPKRKGELREIVQRFRRHPALALWKNQDEPAWGEPPPATPEDLLSAYRYLRKLDPDHPVWMTHAPRGTVEVWRKYCKACDIAAVDIYPISVPMGKGSHLPNREISVVGDYAEWISQAVDAKKPTFMVLQVGWSGAIPPANIRVFPTFHQERYMACQAIINGARGLLFFGMNVALEGRDGKLGYNWTFWNEVMRPLLREIGKGSELHPALLAPDSKLPLTVKGAPDIEYTCREVGPFLYILAAKREGSPASIEFSGEFLEGEVQVMFENRKLQAKDGAFTDRFGRNDVHVYKVRLG